MQRSQICQLSWLPWTPWVWLITPRAFGTFICICSKLLAAYVCFCRQYANFKGHIRVLLEVAANAAHGDKKRRHVLCQFYDELARKEWAELAARGDQGFSVEDACQTIDRDILETARREYDDTLGPVASFKATSDAYEVVHASKGKSSGKAAGKGKASGKDKRGGKQWPQKNNEYGSSREHANWEQNKKYKSWHR